MKKRFEIAEGNEIRGMMIRLYPTIEDQQILMNLEDDLKLAWNWLVNQSTEVDKARVEYALKQKLIEPKPVRQPKEAATAAETHRTAVNSWFKELKKAVGKDPACAYRSFKEQLKHFGCRHDYQLLSRVIRWRREEIGIREGDKLPYAHFLQALTKNFFVKSDRPKRHRKRTDSMPIQTRSEICFFMGNYGERRGKQFYNCQVRVNGLTIRGRLPGMPPKGRILQGVSITKKADGWWASIKMEVPKRQLPTPIAGTSIGIDAGLDYLATFSDGRQVQNLRDKEFTERIAGRQAIAATIEDPEKRKIYESCTRRLQQKATRQTLHLIYNEIVKPMEQYETIVIEKLCGRIGQMGRTKAVSAMRKMAELLKERYGERVREVDPSYTSQDCSQCGHRSKEAWSYEHGRFGECPACGYKEDRDINAARNIANRAA